MRFAYAVPRGPDAAPESAYTGLRLEDRAPDDRPWVVCNFVSSADGRATIDGRSGRLGGPGDRAAFHLLRTQADAILAGTGTLRVERYGLLVEDERLAAIREHEGRARQPLAVVVSRSGRVPFEVPLFSDRRVRIALYAPAGVRVPADCAADVTLHERSPDGGSDAIAGGGLAGVLHSLRSDHGVRSLLCEGGPSLFGGLLAADLVDELFLTLAPALVGTGERAVTAGPPLPAVRSMRLVWALEHDGDLFLRYERRRVEGAVAE